MNVKTLLKIENLAILIGVCCVYYILDFSWLLFAILFLVFDISMLGYLVSNKTGAIVYNIFHTYTMPFLIVFLAYLFKFNTLIEISIIWIAHIATDRAFGYGLKLDDFNQTHLN